MTVIKRHAVHKIIIRRERDIAGTDRTSLHATATVDVALQSLSREARAVQGIGLDEKVLIAWFDLDQDIKEGDQIYVADSSDPHYGEVYEVQELTIRDYGINQHIEAVLKEHNA